MARRIREEAPSPAPPVDVCEEFRLLRRFGVEQGLFVALDGRDGSIPQFHRTNGSELVEGSLATGATLVRQPSKKVTRAGEQDGDAIAAMLIPPP